MPSPDVAGYVDLRLLDLDAVALVERALADATVKLPAWQPREGNTEVVLLESTALITAELAFAANRLPGALAEVLLRLFGVNRDAGAAPRFTATLTTSNTGAITIPAGTRFALEPGGGLDRVELVLEGPVPVPAATTTATGTLVGLEPSTAANGVTGTVALEVLDAVAFLDSATAVLLSAGRAPEDAARFLDRGAVRLRRLVDTLTLPSHFTAAALEDVRVARARTLDMYDGVGPNLSTDLGHVTVAVAGPSGTLLSSALKLELENTLEAQALAGLDVHVIDVNLNLVTITTTVTAATGYANATVIADVVAALDAYLNPDTWEFEAALYRNELIALVDRVPAVRRVVSLTITGADGNGDLILTGNAPLVDLGTATVTVTV